MTNIDETNITPEIQARLNDPLNDPTGVSDEHKNFLKTLLHLVKDGKINLYTPSSLINQSIYNKLPFDIRGKIDMEAVNMLSAIRNIKDLTDTGNTITFQIQNMVETIWNTKSRIEKVSGDVFII